MILHGTRPVLLGCQTSGLRHPIKHEYLVLIGSPVDIRGDGVYLIAFSVFQPFHFESDIPLQIFL